MYDSNSEMLAQIIPLKRKVAQIPGIQPNSGNGDCSRLSRGCNSGLNIREDSRTIAFDISTAAAAPGPAGLCGRAKQAAQSRAA
jgi:hypothetical protein